jgi:hypothetical protein
MLSRRSLNRAKSLEQAKQIDLESVTLVSMRTSALPAYHLPYRKL